MEVAKWEGGEGTLTLTLKANGGITGLTNSECFKLITYSTPLLPSFAGRSVMWLLAKTLVSVVVDRSETTVSCQS